MDELSGVARLDRQFAEFGELVRQAQGELRAGRFEAAAGWAQIAAGYAWLNHTGLFAATELEELLAELATHVISGPARPTDRSGPPRQVLHVLTQAYGVGGHTQMLARWIAQDDKRRHRVVLTRQGTTPLPVKLSDRLRSPDELSSLDDAPGGLLRRAARLRERARSADLVLLHIHPYDVVPSLAFGVSDGLPPVITVNHSDHAFWVGTRVTSVLLNLRDSGRDLAVHRRGIEPERAAVMARPLGLLTQRTISRAQAKARFGVAENRVLIVTAAAGTKYEPLTPPSLLELIVPVFQANPDAMLLAAGPDPVGQWAEADRLTGGRVRALGRLPDVTELHQAADGYLDSFPFASLTSMIESGSFGNPLLTYRGHPAECAVLGADTRGLDEYLLRPDNPAALRAELTRMITDQAWRVRRGEDTRIAIEASHVGAGWQAGVEQLYALAGRLPVAPSPGSAPRGTGPVDVLVELVQSQTGYSAGRSGAISQNLGVLPAGQRLRCWWRLARTGSRQPVKSLLPEWLLPPLSRLRGRLSR
ncbi:MAG: hypothetical protein M3Y42_07280 [Actinomycetota bacterium]|nr:hypothetical protein [Actinomycetota bacterium]MDQ2956749.1 hypothetical protein [Actinomycetota bacterium]